MVLHAIPLDRHTRITLATGGASAVAIVRLFILLQTHDSAFAV
jgi:hypothetical protein